MARSAAPEALLSLLSAGEPGDLAPDLDWAAIDRLAAMHRLQPRLHALHRDNAAIPSVIRSAWQAAHRASAIAALAQQADLADCAGLLAEAGLPPVALKGAWLARFAYPHPAERPLRDIDLLLAPDELVPAWQLLERAGYVRDYPFDGTLEQEMARFRHLPALRSPRGTAIELHHRLWQPDECRAASPPAETPEQRMRRRAIDRDGILYPATDDLIVHLIVHAAHSHALDCGPLVLADLALAANREPPEAHQFWDRATAGGWSAGAALLIALSRRWHGESALPAVPAGRTPPPAVLSAGAALLLQDPQTRIESQVAGNVIAAGPGTLAGRFARVRETTGGSLLGWLASRVARSASQLLDSGFRDSVRDHACIAGWLRG